ncbi:uncharacterized protein TNCV_984441 [Trichonephila clavipes]|nr:uncharacterized protein TNCV_984441 [Trichonephila clavipes]
MDQYDDDECMLSVCIHHYDAKHRCDHLYAVNRTWIHLKKWCLTIHIPRIVVDHTIEDTYVWDTASRVAAAMVIELFVQTFFVLQATPILIFEHMTMQHDPLRPCRENLSASSISNYDCILSGVLGNERADWLAKAATKRKIDIDVNIPKSIYKKITKERMVKSWNEEYLISNKGSITKKFSPTINKRLSCHHFYTNYNLTQFLTGHGNFKSYLNKFNLVPSSFCDCNIGGEENVEHVILLCSKYVRDRTIIRLAF